VASCGDDLAAAAVFQVQPGPSTVFTVVDESWSSTPEMSPGS
jgi:hypothetical protein